MGVLYSTSPVGAFSSSLLLISIFFILGFGNLFLLYLTRKPRKKRSVGNYVTIILSILLIVFGVATTIATFNTYQNGDKTVRVQALEKREVVTKCNKYYCTEYNVETTDGEKFYVFGLTKGTWDEIRIEACYQFTYYPLKPLLADYLQEESDYPNLYEMTGYITRIEQIGCSS